MFIRFLVSCCLACAACVALFGRAAQAEETITLQLKWTHAFQFAGYYAAREKGYYRDAGLEVVIREAVPGEDSVKYVTDGQAQYGVSNSNLLLARKAGQPVVALAVIFQHSPLVLIARQQGPTQGIHDLAGKRVMLEHQSDELLAYLRQEGIPRERITLIEHSFKPQDLIDGKVDAISAYVTNEPFYLERARFSYQSYTPRAAGIDFYGDNLFTTEQELTAHPARVKAFRDASLRGWLYAMNHPEEIADLILAKYSHQHPREFYLYEARQMVPLFRTDLVEIGYMNPGRWRHIADTYADLGLLPRKFPLDGFLYQPDAEARPAWLYTSLAIALAAVLSVGVIAAYIFRMNRRLAAIIIEREQIEGKMRTLALHDTLTSLPNRRLLNERMSRALAASRRSACHGAAIFLDLDNFKVLNDSYGHDVGDLLLVEAASRLRACVREVDTVSRFGGDEFVVMLGALSADGAESVSQAAVVAEKIRIALAQPYRLTVRHEGQSGGTIIEHHCSASIGVYVFGKEDSQEDILKWADTAMYQAKEAGGNGVRFYTLRG